MKGSQRLKRKNETSALSTDRILRRGRSKRKNLKIVFVNNELNITSISIIRNVDFCAADALSERTNRWSKQKNLRHHHKHKMKTAQGKDSSHRPDDSSI